MLHLNLKHTQEGTPFFPFASIPAREPGMVPGHRGLKSQMVFPFCHPSHPLLLSSLSPSSSSSSPWTPALASFLLGDTVTHHAPSFILHSAPPRRSRAGSACDRGTTAVLSSSSALPITVVSWQVLFWGGCLFTTGPHLQSPCDPWDVASTAAALTLGAGTPGDRR